MSEPFWVPLAAAPPSGFPAGAIVPYVGASPPVDWLACDGAAISRTTYAELYAAIGTTFGVGDGSTTFNLPDLRGRAPVGRGSNVAVDTLGKSDGVAEANRRPQHQHTAHAHTTPSINQGSTNTSNGFQRGDTGAGSQAALATSAADGGSGVATDPLNAPAYLVVGYIIRTTSGAGIVTPASAVPLVTALPGSPVDGQEVLLTDSLTAGTYQWHLRYVAARASNRWVFVGGPPAYSEVATRETSATANAYVALATPGPSIAVPVAGDYLVSLGAAGDNAGGNYALRMSYDIGATAAVDADAAMIFTDSSIAGVGRAANSRPRRKTLAAGTLTAKYKSSGGTMGVQDRWMEVVPIAVGG